MICDSSLAKEKFAKINMHEQAEHMGKWHIFDICIDIIRESLDICGSLGQHNCSSRDSIDRIKNCGNADSRISNVIYI